MPNLSRCWIALAAVLCLGALAPEARAQGKLVVGNAGGSSADAERKVFYGPFATANNRSQKRQKVKKTAKVVLTNERFLHVQHPVAQ